MSDEAFLRSVGGKMIAHGDAPGGVIWNFGWVPPEQREGKVLEKTEKIASKIPDFNISGSWQLESDRYAQWYAHVRLFGNHSFYNWQVTGSCVGAGGGNMLRTLMCLEILSGDMEQYSEIWWPWTYGQSRRRSGMNGKGDGSTGTGWGEAITRDGCFFVPEGDNRLPKFQEKNGWLQLTSREEMDWSDGRSTLAQWQEKGAIHLVSKMAMARSADDVVAAMVNGMGCTQASNFGFSPMAPAPRGNPPVRIASWNGSWAHQTYVDEYWKHPTEGEIFRWGNNWGPGAHGSPTGKEPPGGVYITKNTMDQLCKRGEVIIFSGFSGMVAKKLDLRP